MHEVPVLRVQPILASEPRKAERIQHGARFGDVGPRLWGFPDVDVRRLQSDEVVELIAVNQIHPGQHTHGPIHRGVAVVAKRAQRVVVDVQGNLHALWVGAFSGQRPLHAVHAVVLILDGASEGVGAGTLGDVEQHVVLHKRLALEVKHLRGDFPLMAVQNHGRLHTVGVHGQHACEAIPRHGMSTAIHGPHHLVGQHVGEVGFLNQATCRLTAHGEVCGHVAKGLPLGDGRLAVGHGEFETDRLGPLSADAPERRFIQVQSLGVLCVERGRARRGLRDIEKGRLGHGSPGDGQGQHGGQMQAHGLCCWCVNLRQFSRLCRAVVGKPILGPSTHVVLHIEPEQIEVAFMPILAVQQLAANHLGTCDFKHPI